MKTEVNYKLNTLAPVLTSIFQVNLC